MSCWEHTEEQAEELFSHSLELQNESRHVDSLNILTHLLEHHLDELEECRIREYIGSCYFSLEQYELAISHLKIAWKIRDNNVDDLNLLSILKFLAISNYILGESQESMRYFEIAEQYLDSCPKEEYPLTKFLILLNKGRCYLDLGQYESSLTELLNSEEELKDFELDDAQLVRINILNYEIGRVYVYINDLRNAKKRLEKVQFEMLDVNLHSGYRSIKLRYYYFMKEYESVLESFSIYEKDEIPKELRAEAYFFVGAAHQKLGDKDKATKYYTLALENNLFFNWQKRRATNFLRNLEASTLDKFIYFLKQLSVR